MSIKVFCEKEIKIKADLPRNSCIQCNHKNRSTWEAEHLLNVYYLPFPLFQRYSNSESQTKGKFFPMPSFFRVKATNGENKAKTK